MAVDPLRARLFAHDGEVRVVGLAGQEAISRPYHFDVHLLADADEGFARRILLTPMSLVLGHGDDAGRVVHGVVTACEATGRRAGGAPAFLVRMEPRLALLRHRRTSRIFQDMTAREIVEEVLALSRVPNRWQLLRDLPRRVYCAQYDETDHDFVARLCASEGIFFLFDQPGDADTGAAETLVLCDCVEGYAPIEGRPELRFRPLDEAGSSLTAEEDHVHAFGLRHAARPRRVLLRSFDFERPPIPQRDAESLDRATAPDDLDSMRAFVDGGATIYEHAHAREQALLSPIPAKLALDAEAADAALAEAESGCRRLAPGRRFRLVDHVVPELDGEYAVVSCSHEATSPQGARDGQPIYRNRFTAVPASVPFRPPRPRRTVRQTLETATVVGPRGQEIHTDELGRVKVQFHWDLQGKRTDRSSCWLRVVQPWAGSGYGTHFLPRVGMEVLVGYIDGDADRPVVMGCLHNGLNATPHSLPQDFERSGIKTWTTPDGKGGHELLFDDRAGAELVSLRSARTMDLSAAENMAVRAEGNLRVVSGASRQDEVLGEASTTIRGDETRTIGGSRRASVAEHDSTEVGGTRQTTVRGDDVQRVEGIALHVFARSRATVIGALSGEEADEQLGVSGKYGVSSAREMKLESKTGVLLVCGDSKITLLPDRIVLDAPSIQIQAKDRIALVQGDPPAATLVLQGSASLAGGTVVAKGGGDGGGTLVLDAEAHLDGALVKLNCGSSGGAGAAVMRSQPEKNKVKFTVHREGLDADVETVTLVIATPGGEVVEKECPVGGSVELEGQEGEVFTVVETRVKGKAVPARKKSEATEGESR